jgi:hypothetical protein
MTNEQIALWIASNGIISWGVLRWGMKQAIDYTHKIRDIKELQDKSLKQDLINEKVERDLKGLSMKIDGKIKP